MKIEISRLHYPVTVLGPGRRVGIWFQGCSIGCKGCVSKDTWPSDSTRSIDLSELFEWCREMAMKGLDGITISGGEPFDQSSELLSLLVMLNEWREKSKLDFDVLCYSGYTLKYLLETHPEIIRMLDALIPEPFNHRVMPGLKWRGSANQSLVPLTDRAKRIYSDWVNAKALPEMQIAVSKNILWLIGIPPPGGLEKFTSACADKGLHLKDTSWQP